MTAKFFLKLKFCMKIMANSDISSWVSQPDVCRCCLSGSGTWDLAAEHVTDAGDNEVFANTLKDCFGISLSHLNEMDSSHMVCDLCVNQLRGASHFRQQVVRADKWFSDYWTSKNDMNNSPSIEHEKTAHTKTRRKINLKAKRPKRLEVNSSDSDTPIAKLKNDSSDVDYIEEFNNPVFDEAKENIHAICEKKEEIHLTGKPRVNNNIKQVSERKRIIVTCSTVLIETTACPFRHHKSWFRCFFCTENFMEINSLRTHVSQSHPNIESELKKIKRYPRSLQIEITNLECRHCHSKLTDIETMALHFIEKHNKVIYKECIADYKVNSFPYTCHLCEKQFHVFRSLTTHLNEHYANCICDVCGKSFINTKRLKVHKSTHENGTYPCNTCGKVLKTKTSQSNHMESAHSKRQIKCQICFKPMKHYNDRIKHMSEVHNITHKFKCPICDREYNIKHYLATHIRQTHGHKNKKCAVCNMAFITNHGLKKHMSKHTGDRPFTCNVCSKSYARSYTLREHMRAHDCDKRFLSPT